MPVYKLKLEAEVHCPEDKRKPELTITPQDIKNSLLRTGSCSGYAVCGVPTDANYGKKLTASLCVVKVEFEPLTCMHCGQKVEVPVT